MKKLYVLASSMLLAATTFAAEGDNYWYIRGDFNDYTPDYNNKWALMDDDESEPNVFTGTFEVPAGELKFNLMNPDGNIFVPFQNNSYFNETIEFTNNTFVTTCALAWDDYDEVYCWNDASWGGGQITVSVDASSNNPTVEIYAFPSATSDEYNYEYTIYPLTNDQETAVFWEAGNIDDVWFNSGDAYLVDTEGNEIILVKSLSGQEGQVTLCDDDPYGLIINISSLELAEGVYTVVIPAEYIQVVSNDWEDFLYNPEISYEIEVTEVAPAVIYWYIRGAFNNYDPKYADEWALMDDDESEENNGVYTGTFTIPAGEFSFNLLAPNGVVYIPATLDNEEVVFENNSYFGYADYAFDEVEEAYSWQYSSWAGGMITVSIDANTGEIEIYAFPDATSDDYNTNYTITGLSEDGVITILWDGAIDDVWYEAGNAYVVDAAGNETVLAKNVPGQPGQVTLCDTDPYGLSIDITSLGLDKGDYTLVIPAEYIQIVSNDWEDWLYNPEIKYNFTVSTVGISSIEAAAAEGNVYTIQGLKVNNINNLPNGIYVINGKKVMIRK